MAGWRAAWLTGFGRAIARLFGGQPNGAADAGIGQSSADQCARLAGAGHAEDACRVPADSKWTRNSWKTWHNLALDFERKREFVLADSVLRATSKPRGSRLSGYCATPSAEPADRFGCRNGVPAEGAPA